MPAYNFKKQFAAAVESGTKTTTIRPPRKRTTRVGDILYLYTGQRTKQCRKLGEAECISVSPIDILWSDMEEKSAMVRLNEGPAHLIELILLAHADGFSCVSEFLWFFIRQYGLPFHGELICWKLK